MTYFPLHQTTCFFIPLVAPCKPLLRKKYTEKQIAEKMGLDEQEVKKILERLNAPDII